MQIDVALQAAALAASSVALALYVASEDGYRDNGTSRWEAYGAQRLTVAAVGVGVVGVLLLAGAWTSRRRGLRVTGFLTSIAAAVLQFLAVFANSLN